VSTLRLLHVHAHPDDESSKGAASTARYVAEGVAVHVVTCTGGERGSVLNPQYAHPDIDGDMAAMTAARRAEMERAAQILGVTHHWLGWIDSGLPEGDPLPPLPDDAFARIPLPEAAAPLVALIRQIRPQVVTTYDERGGYPHPDHIKCHVVSLFAVAAAGDHEAYPEAGEPWQVAKLYFHHEHSQIRARAVRAAMAERGLPWPFGPVRPVDDAHEARATTRVECAAYLDVRDAALRAHASQIEPHGDWFAIPNDVQSEIWPTDDFELVASRVETSVPESDLFSGLR
jgi:mycothiol S-conjugate amidase